MNFIISPKIKGSLGYVATDEGKGEGDKVAQLVRCQTSNQRVAGLIPGHSGHFGQDSLFHIASVYPAAKWVPSINKAVLRVCALYAASCSGISPRGIEMVSVCTVPARGGRSCEHFGGYKTINRIPLPLMYH